MAQVVETDTLHLVCYQKIWEMLAQEIGPNPLSHRVYIRLFFQKRKDVLMIYI